MEKKMIRQLTKHSLHFEIAFKTVCVSALVGSNPHHYESVVPARASSQNYM